MSKPGFYPHVREFLHLQARLIEDGLHDIRQRPDANAVHRLRVALRRTRSILDTLDLGRARLRRQLREAGRSLGRVRDIDIQIEPLRNHPGLAAYQTHLEAKRARRCARLELDLAANRYLAIPADLEALANALPSAGPALHKAAGKYLRRQLKRVKRRGRALSSASPIDELHALRIECKKLHYLAELFAHRDALPLNHLRRSVRSLQTLLGDLNDNTVKIAAVSRYAATLNSPTLRAELLDLGRYIGLCETNSVALRRNFAQRFRHFDHHCKGSHLPR